MIITKKPVFQCADLDPLIKSEILEHGKNSSHEEVCGYIDSKFRVIRCDNLAEDKSTSFIADIPGDAIAVWHTHTNESARLSFHDVAQAQEQSLPYICCDPVNEEWDFYDPTYPHPYPLETKATKDQIAFYLNRRFEWGRSDCYELARDWYRGMLGIDIGTVERQPTLEKEWHPEWDRYNQELPGKGFEKLDLGTPFQVHDLLLLYGMFYDAAHHIMICVQPELTVTPYFLHILAPGRISEITNLMPYEKNLHGGSIWRHKDVLPSN